VSIYGTAWQSNLSDPNELHPWQSISLSKSGSDITVLHIKME